jgi:hypothetical protein
LDFLFGLSANLDASELEAATGALVGAEHHGGRGVPVVTGTSG